MEPASYRRQCPSTVRWLNVPAGRSGPDKHANPDMWDWPGGLMEQKHTGRLIRPSAIYTGPSARKANEVDGWNPDWAK